MPTATTYLKSHKRADKRTALQSLKDRFDYGLNPEKLGAFPPTSAIRPRHTPSSCW